MDNELMKKSAYPLYGHSLRKLWGLIRWSLIRHKYLIPTFSIVQAVFAVAIVCGLSLLIPNIDMNSTVYLSSGALTLGIIAVGCVLAPQIASESKQNGLYEYQRTLPVARCSILVADIIIWTIASLPGVVMSCIAAVLRFGVYIHISPLSIFLILMAQISMICIGFSIAYWLPPNAMALTTQIIMIGGLLFSPITYPAERLPGWLIYVYQALPFVPVSNLLRSSLFRLGEVSILDIFVVFLWMILAVTTALGALAKRR
ncbi:MAG: ABC2-membrane domain-containing protein [Lachnoclostridium sp.]|jgi:ABC-2 type transport system permease protein